MPRLKLTKAKVNTINRMELTRLRCAAGAKRLSHKSQAEMFIVTLRTIERIHFEKMQSGDDFPQLHITTEHIRMILAIDKLKKIYKKFASELTREKQAKTFCVHKNTVCKIHNGETWSGIRRNKNGSYQPVFY